MIGNDAERAAWAAEWAAPRAARRTGNFGVAPTSRYVLTGGFQRAYDLIDIDSAL